MKKLIYVMFLFTVMELFFTSCLKESNNYSFGIKITSQTNVNGGIYAPSGELLYTFSCNDKGFEQSFLIPQYEYYILKASGDNYNYRITITTYNHHTGIVRDILFTPLIAPDSTYKINEKIYP